MITLGSRFFFSFILEPNCEKYAYSTISRLTNDTICAAASVTFYICEIILGELMLFEILENKQRYIKI